MTRDCPVGRSLVVHFGGSVYSAVLDSSHKKTLLAAERNLVGIAYAEALPPAGPQTR